MTMGEMLRQFLTKLEWYSTLFPRIPVPIQKDIQQKFAVGSPIQNHNILGWTFENTVCSNCNKILRLMYRRRRLLTLLYVVTGMGPRTRRSEEGRTSGRGTTGGRGRLWRG